MKKTAIITVLYNSQNWQPIEADGVINIVVDNTPARDLDLKNSSILQYIPLKENRGIAAAQNVGIKQAFKLGVSYLIFFDQDSYVSKELINGLISQYIDIKKTDSETVAIGPQLVEINSGQTYKSSNLSNDSNRVLTLISSGMTTDSESLKRVGLMDECLFIDYVDHEWCFRATYKGGHLYQTPEVTMNHQVGAKSIEAFGIPFIISAPVRYFYSTRNLRWLTYRRYVPVKWKIKSWLKFLFLCSLLPFASQLKGGRAKRISYLWRGLFYNTLK